MDFENQKVIPPIFSNNKTVGNVWWLTWQDIIWLFFVIIISILCSIPVFFSAGIWGVLPLGIINLIGWLLIIKIGNVSFHNILITWIAWFILKKEYTSEEFNIIKDQKEKNELSASVEYLNGQKVWFFEIIGTNTANFGELEIAQFQKTLRDFFNNPNSFGIYKIDIPFNFDEIYKKSNLIENQELKDVYLNSVKKKILDEISSEHKTFLVFKNPDFKNIDQVIMNLQNSLAHENIDLLPVSSYSKKFLLKEIFLQGYEKILDKFSYLTLTRDNKNEYVSFLKINQLPNFVSIDWISELLEQEGFDIAIECSQIPNKECRDMIDQALLTSNSFFNIKRKSSAVDEAISEFQIYALNELKKDFAINQETIKNTSFIFRIRSDSLKNLKIEKERLRNFLWNKKMVPNSLLGLQWKALKSWLPIYSKSQNSKKYRKKLIKSNFNLPSGTLSFGMPFSINKVFENDGVIFGSDSNGYPVILNFFNTTNKVPNRNIVLIGQSGSGKTSTVVQIVSNVLNFGKSKTIIIDPSNEYASQNLKMNDKNLLKYFEKATVIDVSNSKNFRINPFSIWPEQSVQEKIDFISNFFKILFDKILNNKQIQLLVNICFDIYKNDINKNFSFSEILEFFEKSKKNDDRIIAFALKQYCKGNVYGEYWDDKTILNFNSDLIIFNINGLREDSKIFEAQLYIIMNYLLYSIYNNLKDDRENLFLVIDEEHKLINSDYPFILNTVVELNKQARKYGGAVLNSTQNLKDFIKTSALKENAVNILDNSSTLFCMKLNENDIKGLDELMSEIKPLTDNEKLVIRNQQRGQALLFRGNDKVFLNVWKIF